MQGRGTEALHAPCVGLTSCGRQRTTQPWAVTPLFHALWLPPPPALWAQPCVAGAQGAVAATRGRQQGAEVQALEARVRALECLLLPTLGPARCPTRAAPRRVPVVVA